MSTPIPGAGQTDERDAEISRLRTANRELHRRVQQIEAPAHSYAQRLEHIGHVSGQAWVREFDRLIRSHTEVKRIFQELARVFEYPMNAQCFHSVMDSNCEALKDTADGAVYANCFLSKAGGMKSFRVLDEVRRAVDELIAGRAALAAAGAPTDDLHFNAQRLRNVVALVGLESAIPQDDVTLDGARGAVLGQIASKLRAAGAPVQQSKLGLDWLTIARKHGYALPDARMQAFVADLLAPDQTTGEKK